MIAKNIIIRNEDQRIVEGVIYPAFQLDTYDTMMLPADLAKMCHDFSIKRMADAVDVEHNEIKSGSRILRHWIALPDDPDGYPAGSWVGLCKVYDDELWSRVKRGEINGFSIQAKAVEVAFDCVVNMVQRAEGATETSTNDTLLPHHTHEVVITFDAKGSVIPCETSEVLGHKHTVYYSTATQEVFEHSHPIIIGS